MERQRELQPLCQCHSVSSQAQMNRFRCLIYSHMTMTSQQKQQLRRHVSTNGHFLKREVKQSLADHSLVSTRLTQLHETVGHS